MGEELDERKCLFKTGQRLKIKDLSGIEDSVYSKGSIFIVDKVDWLGGRNDYVAYDAFGYGYLQHWVEEGYAEILEDTSLSDYNLPSTAERLQKINEKERGIDQALFDMFGTIRGTLDAMEEYLKK